MRTTVEVTIDMYADAEGCNVTACVRNGHDTGRILAQVGGKYVYPNYDDVARVIGDSVAHYLRNFPTR